MEGSEIDIKLINRTTYFKQTSIDECQLKMDYTDVMTFINQANLEVILEKQFDETLFLSCKTKKK